jgi:hypothetical protein
VQDVLNLLEHIADELEKIRLSAPTIEDVIAALGCEEAELMTNCTVWFVCTEEGECYPSAPTKVGALSKAYATTGKAWNYHEGVVK